MNIIYVCARPWDFVLMDSCGTCSRFFFSSRPTMGLSFFPHLYTYLQIYKPPHPVYNTLLSSILRVPDQSSSSRLVGPFCLVIACHLKIVLLSFLFSVPLFQRSISNFQFPISNSAIFSVRYSTSLPLSSLEIYLSASRANSLPLISSI